MPSPTIAFPRWAIAVAAGALMLLLLTLGGVRANAQTDATPTPSATATPKADDEDNVTAADDGTGEAAPDNAVEAADADFAVGDELLVTDGPLHLRARPGLDAEVRSHLDAGTAVEITDGPEQADDSRWYEVVTEDDETGWVAGEFLGTDAVSPEFSSGDEVEVIDGPLNVRDDGSLNGEVMRQLEIGDRATVLSGPAAADDYTWYEIEIDSETSGWVAGEFLATADGASVASDGDFAVGDGLRVATDGMNFRADAGLEAEVLDTLDVDALFLVQDGPVSADGYTWYQVFNYYYGEGWIAGELMTFDPDGFPLEESE